MAIVQHVSIKVFGSVQGVFFRYHSQKKAESIGIKGCVSNQEDGSVLIEAEGDKKQLREFIAWCRHGPSGAIVEKIETEFSKTIKNFSRFEITYS